MKKPQTSRKRSSFLFCCEVLRISRYIFRLYTKRAVAVTAIPKKMKDMENWLKFVREAFSPEIIRTNELRGIKKRKKKGKKRKKRKRKRV